MGDRLVMIGAINAGRHDPRPGLARVVAHLQAQGVIGQKNDPAASLGDNDKQTFRPGPAADATGAHGLHGRLTNGVVVETDGIFNFFELNTDVFTCPVCGTEIKKDQRDLFDPQLNKLGTAASNDILSRDAVPCVICGAETGVNDWAYDFIYARFGLSLWNWPCDDATIAPFVDALRVEFPEDTFKIGVGKL